MKRLAGFTSTMLAGCILCTPFGVLAEKAGATASVSDNIEKLIKTNSCRDCNLEGGNLNRLDLEGADLEGANLSKAKLYLTNLEGANLKNSRLCDAGLGGADLANADLRGADLTGTSLDGAYTVGALFDLAVEQQESQNTDREEVVKVERPADKGSDALVVDVEEPAAEQSEATTVAVVADQAEVVPEASALSVVKGDDAEKPVVNTVGSAPSPKKIQPMKAIEVDEAVIAPEVTAEVAVPVISDEVTLQEEKDTPGLPVVTVDEKRTKAMARLLEKKQCYGCDLSGLDFSGINLKDVDLERADLTGCNFSGANLRNGNFKGAVVLNANLRDTDLRGADFYKADLSGTDLTGAMLDSTIFEDSQLYGVVGLNQDLMLPEDAKK